MAGKVQIPSSSGTGGLGGGASKLGGGVMKRLNPKSESVALVSRLLLFILHTASLKPKWVSVKVPRRGALNIEMWRYGDSKTGFCKIVGVPSLLYKIKNYFLA